MSRMKKLGLVAVLLSVLLGAAAFWHSGQVQSGWADHELRVATLKATAQQGSDLVYQDTHNVRFGLGQEALRPFFQAAEGLEIRAAAGHRVVMKRFETHFERGLMRVHAEADFDSRLLLYRSPLVISYLAFSDMDAEGRCMLRFYVERIEVQNLPLLARRWFETWLSLTLQESMPLPELRLPLHFKTKLPFPAMERLVKKRNLTVSVPTRSLDLVAENPALAMTPHCLQGAVFTHPGIVAPPVPDPLAQPDCARADTLGLAVSMPLLNQTIAAVIEPEVDIRLHTERMTNVVNKQKKILGITTTNKLDIVDFEAELDIHEASLEYDADRLWLSLHISGQAHGRLEGKMYGIPLNNWVDASPKLTQRVPIRLVEKAGRLDIEFEQETLALEGKGSIEVLGRKVRFSIPLDIKPRFLSRSIPIEQWMEKEYKVPRKIKGKKVVAEQTYRLLFNWKLDQASLAKQWLWLEADQITLEPIAP